MGLFRSPSLRYILFVFLWTRLWLSGVAAAAWLWLPIDDNPLHRLDGWPQDGWYGILVTVWHRWDTIHYIDIAANGYDEFTSVFYPLYPLAIRAVHTLTNLDYLLSALAVSNVSYLFVLFFLHRLTALELGREAANRAVLYLAVFPTAFFFLAGYNESLFLALALGCFYYARRGNWAAACLLGAGAALTRQQGVLLLLPLVYVYARERRFSLKAMSPNALSLGLVPAASLGFSLWRTATLDVSWSLLPTLQRYWGTQLAWPWETLWIVGERLIQFWSQGELSPLLHTAKDLTIVTLFITLAVLSLSRLPREYSLFAGAILALMLMFVLPGPPMPSVSRYALAAFPCFMVLADFGKNKVMHRTVVLVSLAGLTVFTAYYATAWWIA